MQPTNWRVADEDAESSVSDVGSMSASRGDSSSLANVVNVVVGWM